MQDQLRDLMQIVSFNPWFLKEGKLDVKLREQEGRKISVVVFLFCFVLFYCALLTIVNKRHES